MAAKAPMTDATRKVMADALGLCQQAEVDKQFLEVLGHPPAEEAIERLNHLHAIIKAGLDYDRRAREGQL